MKIDASSSSSGARPDQTPRQLTPRPAPAGGAGTEPTTDAIEISPAGRRIVEFPTDARARAELIARLRQEVDAGTYRPDADAIARRLAEGLDR